MKNHPPIAGSLLQEDIDRVMHIMHTNEVNLSVAAYYVYAEPSFSDLNWELYFEKAMKIISLFEPQKPVEAVKFAPKNHFTSAGASHDALARNED